MSILTTNLMLLMERANLNETQLAREISISQPAVNKLMSGATTDPRISTLMPIAEYFKITIDQLLGMAPLNTTIGSAKNQNSTKLPVFPWEQCEEYLRDLSAISPLNWHDWIAVNKTVSKSSYATKIKNSVFPAPFADNTIVTIDPLAPRINGCYILVKGKNTHTMTIKKCLFDDSTLWLISLIDGIQPILWTDNWIIFGAILEAYLNLYRQEGPL